MSPLWNEIMHERALQDKRWGGVEHDNTHEIFDWIVYLAKHTGKAIIYTDNDAPIFRKQMVKVAALAVATIEWYDRKMIEIHS